MLTLASAAATATPASKSRRASSNARAPAPSTLPAAPAARATQASTDPDVQIMSPPKGGAQEQFGEPEDISIGTFYLKFLAKTYRDKIGGLSNAAVAEGVHHELQKSGGLGANRSVHQIKTWLERKKTVYKKMKEHMNKSGGKRLVALEGEKVKKGMVSLAMWKILQSLYGGDVAIVPPKRLLAHAGGGMSEAQLQEALAEQKKEKLAKENKGAKKKRMCAQKEKPKKALRTEIDDALSAEGSDSDSENSLDVAMRGDGVDHEGSSLLRSFGSQRAKNTGTSSTSWCSRLLPTIQNEIHNPPPG